MDIYSRYLYVNSRPWPQNYVIVNPLDPPPIAQEIDIHVIDLKTFQEVGRMLRSHRAYTSGNECFFLFLDVSDYYVARYLFIRYIKFKFKIILKIFLKILYEFLVARKIILVIYGKDIMEYV